MYRKININMDRKSEKRTSFKRLANNRVNRVLKDLNLVGNLSNSQNYSYSEKDIKVIFKAIDSELSIAKSRFNAVLNRKNSIKIK
jgi:hypothetical protein